MVLSNDPLERQQAIETFRMDGPDGLAILLRFRDQLLKDGKDPNSSEMVRLNDAIDAVGGARHCSTSRLYWRTDLDEAKAVATQEGKPILSLRMLGNLTDDLSCANSRFFRTTLYANEEIANLLREHFVLHWKSVRPVPKITVDFGDGRKLERTITGNSAHYILLADGTVVDCLPGLYGPQAFRDKLQTLLKLIEAMPPEGAMRDQLLVAYHRREEAKLLKAWQADLEKLGIAPMVSYSGVQGQQRIAAAVRALERGPAAAPPAEAAAHIARPKAAVELPAIAAVRGGPAALEQATTDEVWEKLAALHADEARLDQSSRNLIASQNPTAAVAGALAITKARTESPLVRMFRRLERSVAIDTVRNEYELHRQLHRWFAEGSAPVDVEALNDRVYAELFLTPKTDPWLGLMPADAYSALPNNGVVTK